jgi:phosphate-selective porin OprO/OprP
LFRPAISPQRNQRKNQRGLRVMMTGKKIWMTSAAVLALTAAANAAQPADSATTSIAAQPLQLAQATPVQMAQNTYGQDSTASGTLEQRVKALEDALASQNDRASSDRTRLSTLEQNYNYASWSFDNGRPTLATGDGRFTMSVRLRMQTDYAGFSQSAAHPAGFAGPADLSSGAVERRAYFGVEGYVYKDFWYEFRLNGGGSDGGNNATCTATAASVTTITGAPGATAATTTTPTCAVGSIEPAGEGDPLVNKAVVTYVGIPFWHFNFGVIEPSFMMEGSTTSKDLIWLERPEIENIAADSFGAGDSRRGVEVGWSHPDTLWAGDNLAADVAFTGGKTGSAATHGNGGDENTQLLGRVVDRFWSDGISNFEIGFSGAKALYTGNSAGGGSQALRFRDRPEIRVDGTRLIDTGAMAAKTGNMYAADFQGNFQNFYLEGEYARFTADRQCGSLVATNNARCTSSTAVIDHPGFSGWTIGATWILTGETRTYNVSGLAETQASFGQPVPSRPFSLSGNSWGAWELAARYSDTNLNWNPLQTAVTNTLGTSNLAGVLGGDEKIIALGVNWYLNRNVRLMLDDNIVKVKKGTATIPNRDGQNFNVVGIRLQLAN